MCQRAFGLRTLYFLLQMVPLHLSAVPTGSNSRTTSLTFHGCTRIPLLCNAPNIRVWVSPTPGVTVIISCMISVSSPFQWKHQFISSSSSIWNSCRLLVRVFVEIPRSSAILTQGKCKSRRNYLLFGNFKFRLTFHTCVLPLALMGCHIQCVVTQMMCHILEIYSESCQVCGQLIHVAMKICHF